MGLGLGMRFGLGLGLGSGLGFEEGACLPVGHGGGDLAVNVLPVDHLGLGLGRVLRLGVVRLGARDRASGQHQGKGWVRVRVRVGVASQLLADFEEEGSRVLEAGLEGERQLGHIELRHVLLAGDQRRLQGRREVRG